MKGSKRVVKREKKGVKETFETTAPTLLAKESLYLNFGPSFVYNPPPH